MQVYESHELIHSQSHLHSTKVQTQVDFQRRVENDS